MGHEDLLVRVFENTYAITKLAFNAIQTPAYSVHDKPSMGSDTAGVDDAGIKTFSASYRDWGESDVIFISGTDPFETKTVLFTEWMMNQDLKLIMVLPRRTAGVAYAEKSGGLFLQINPGTDTLLHLAISRLIIENGWEDSGFVKEWVANAWEIDSGFGRGTRNTPWQWRTTWGSIGAVSFEDYKKWDSDLRTRFAGVRCERNRNPFCENSRSRKAHQRRRLEQNDRKPASPSRRATTGATTTRTPPATRQWRCFAGQGTVLDAW